MEIKENLKSLLPDELEKLKTTIDKIITELGIKPSTNKRYLLRDNKVECPLCNNSNVVKNGTKNKAQRYLCKSCSKYFSITTNNIINHSKLSHIQLLKILECMARFDTLEITSKEVGISERQAYNIRIKIINLFKKINEKELLKGIVQADEKYLRISFKGTRKAKMPRKSRKNGTQGLKPGIGKEKVCIIGAIDSNDNIILKIVGIGSASTEMIEKALADKIEKNSVLVTDSKTGYIKFAENNNLILKQLPKKTYTIEDIYHLGELNSLFSELEIFIQKFKGLSTRHLQEYLDWFRFRKILKYTVEYLNINGEMFKYITQNKTTLKNAEICKRTFPVDTSELFDDPFL